MKWKCQKGIWISFLIMFSVWEPTKYMCNHLLKSVIPKFVSVKTGLGSQHTVLQQIWYALSNLKITKWVILFTKMNFFLFHEEDQLQDSFKNQGLLKLFTVCYEMQWLWEWVLDEDGWVCNSVPLLRSQENSRDILNPSVPQFPQVMFGCEI